MTWRVVLGPRDLIYCPPQQRLKFIIDHDAGYPGAAEKLTDVLVAMSVPTATSTPLPTPTPNPTGAEGIFNQAQQLIAAGDWPNALVAIDQVRKADPSYRTGAVDGMYYFVLRNYGYYMITQQGNLEGAIGQFETALALNPEYQEGYYSLAQALRQMAAKRSKNAPRQVVVQAERDLKKGEEAIRRNDFREAIEAFRMAKAADPESARGANSYHRTASIFIKCLTG